MSVSGGPDIVESGLVLYLDVANPRSYVSGSTVWSSLNGNGITGSMVSSPSFTSQNAGSLVFNGTSQYVAGPNITSSIWAQNWTACIMAKFDVIATGSSADDKPMINHGIPVLRSGLHLNQRNSRIHFGLYGDDLAGVQLIAPNTWYYVCYTLNNSTFAKQIYVNGRLDSSGTGGGPYSASANPTRIAGALLNFGMNLSGSISTVAIYDRVLSALEIQQNFNAQRTRFGV